MRAELSPQVGRHLFLGHHFKETPMLRYGLICLLAIGLPAAADVYKWVDEAGEVHYSDQPPPPNAKVKEHVKAPAPAAGAPAAAPAQPGNAPASTAAPKSAAEQEMGFRIRQAEREKAEAERQAQLAEDETARGNCEQARNNLAGLQGRTRVTKYGPNGEIIYLTDEEIAAAMVEAQRAVDSWCK
jgi:hypothetical protein